jgi:hypothetical protein
VAFQGEPRSLGLGLRQSVARERRLGDLVAAQLLDDFAWDATLPQLGFYEPSAAGRVAVALLRPPAGERDIVRQAKGGQAIERGLDQRLVGARALQSAAQLPARARPGGEEACGDVQRRVGVERRALFAAPTPPR